MKHKEDSITMKWVLSCITDKNGNWGQLHITWMDMVWRDTELTDKIWAESSQGL